MIIFNADITTVESSGISIDNIDHVELIPQLVEPALPSGGLWFRPNDGQLERLVVQGTSGILEVRNVEGIAFYSSTTVQDISAGSVIISGYTTIVM